MRCKPAEMERGETIRQTRSTVPISIPSSREAVATSARSSPDFSSHFVGRHRAKLAARNFDGQVELAAMTYLHDDRVKPIGASQKTCHELDRFLRCREADAREALAG